VLRRLLREHQLRARDPTEVLADHLDVGVSQHVWPVHAKIEDPAEVPHPQFRDDDFVDLLVWYGPRVRPEGGFVAIDARFLHYVPEMGHVGDDPPDFQGP
jgi:hypothetical protein